MKNSTIMILILSLCVFILSLYMIISNYIYITTEPTIISTDITDECTAESTYIEPDIVDTDIIESTCIEPDTIEVDITESNIVKYTDTSIVEVNITESNIVEYTNESELEIELESESEEEDKWWTDNDLHMLAAVIYYEAGSDECTDRHQQLVGQVVVNRMYSTEFPNTIYDVITQPMQYGTCSMVLNNMGTDAIPQRCYDNALAVLNNDVDCPSDIVWQAGFIQGEIYEVYNTTYSTTYFCHR